MRKPLIIDRRRIIKWANNATLSRGIAFSGGSHKILYVNSAVVR